MIRQYRLSLLAVAALSLPLSACAGNGHFSILGYTTEPNYDCTIRTVYVPIFENLVVQTGPMRGLEFDVTQEVICEIEKVTPYKVVSDRCRADTELIGRITNITKTIINRTQVNEVREAELLVTADLIWRDLRPERNGEILSVPQQGLERLPPAPDFDPNNPVKPVPPPPLPQRVVISASGRMLPELGESTTTGLQMAAKRLAIQIVSMMEKPW